MTKSELIQQLYNEISRQNTVYMSIIGGLITIFAIFQWVINEKRLKNIIENKINKLVIDKYRLNEVMQKSFDADNFMTRERERRIFESSELFNEIINLISLSKHVEDNSDSQHIIVQLIVNKVNMMKMKANNFPEYKHDFEQLIETTNKMDDSVKVIQIIKSVVNFIYDPSTIDEMFEKQTPEP